MHKPSFSFLTFAAILLTAATDPCPGKTEVSDTSDTAASACDTSDTASILDADADGYAACEDLDDNNASVYPGADEVCDGVDNDGDELVDNTDSAVECAVYDASANTCTPVYTCLTSTPGTAGVSNGFLVEFEDCAGGDLLTPTECAVLMGVPEETEPAEVE